MKEDPEHVNSKDRFSVANSTVSPAPNPIPKWRAMFFITVNHQQFPVLGDSGCTGTCMSYDYYIKNPHLKKSFRPMKSCGTAINGSQVPSVGEVNLEFRLEDVPMSMTCKVIKGLMDPLVLG